MNPADIRDNAFAAIQDRLSGNRLKVYECLLRIGPATTFQLSDAMGWTGWSVRPRITELCQAGLVELVAKAGHEGTYQAVPIAEANRRFLLSIKERADEQMLLRV